MQKSFYWGVFLVFLGACSYGVLATIVKLGYIAGYNTFEITFGQFAIGWSTLLLIVLFHKKTQLLSTANFPKKRSLMLAGTSMGLTGVFYYLCVKNVSVSLAIVLLMQSTWMGVVTEWAIEKKRPPMRKVIAAIIVLVGTALAAKIFNNELNLNVLGVIFGLIAALSYTITVFASGTVATNLPALERSFWMLSGGFIIVLFYGLISYTGSFNASILISYGIPLALFGTILPPILFAYGMPSTGTAVGTIIGAVELPVSVLMAYFILNEVIQVGQWIGILLILSAVVLMNYKKAGLNN